MQKPDEVRNQLREGHLQFLRQAEARSDNIASLLIVEIRLDGNWFIQSSNCGLADELAMAEMALTNAREKFKESRLRGLPPPQSKMAHLVNNADIVLGDRPADYYLETEVRFAEARRLFERMQATGNPGELRGMFVGLLEITKTLFFPLKRYQGTLATFGDWWHTQQERLHNDPIAKFFWQQRNDVVKGAHDLLWVQDISLQPGFILPGPNLTYQGMFFVGHPTNQHRCVPPSNLSNATLKWDFRQKPTDDPAPLLCEKYLELLDSVIDDFARTFQEIWAR